MGATLSRKYHYLLNTKKAWELSGDKKLEAGLAINDLKSETETDLPKWIQQLIRDTENDPAAIRSREQRKLIMGALTDETGESFSTHLQRLRCAREEHKEATRSTRPARQLLSLSERNNILDKTDGRCHICGGLIGKSAWHADHVLAHSAGGMHSADNYLPAHALCNNYRWDYSAEEFQLILKLGVWTRTQIERRTDVGCKAAAAFVAHERTRHARQRKKGIGTGQASEGSRN